MLQLIEKFNNFIKLRQQKNERGKHIDIINNLPRQSIIYQIIRNMSQFREI